MGSKKTLVKTIIISGTASVLSYLINFFLTPFITDTLGTAAYGFVTLSKTVASYISIISVAFTAFIVRYIALSYHKGEMEEARAYYSSSMAAVLSISGLVTLFSIFLIPNLQRFIIIPQELRVDVKILFALVFLNFCLSTIVVPFSAACYIKDKLTIYNIFKIASYVTEAVILLILFKFLQTRLWYVGIGLTAATTVILAGCFCVTKKYTPDLYLKRSLVSVKKVFELAQNGVWQSVNSLGSTLNSGLDLWITNLMLTGTALGQLAIAKTIGAIFSMLCSTISQAFQPRMLKAYAKGSKDDLIKELTLAMRVSGFFTGCAFAGFFALGRLYYKLWIPNQDGELIYWLTIVTVLCSVAEGAAYPTYYINTLTTKKKVPSIITVISGLLNVGAMYVLLKYTSLGVFAVVWTTAVISMLNSFVFCAIYCPYTLKLPLYILYPTMKYHP